MAQRQAEGAMRRMVAVVVIGGWATSPVMMMGKTPLTMSATWTRGVAGGSRSATVQAAGE